ncbi:MAG: FliH/SctL family protein [Limimaricola sp.]
MSIFERDFDREIAQERQVAQRERRARHTDEELLTAIEAVRAEALAQGRAEGRAEAEAEARAAETEARSTALGRIAARLDTVLAQEAEHRAALERQILGYAATTAETVLPEILDSRAHTRALAQVRRGLRLGLGAPLLQIALPPASELRADVEALIAKQGLGAQARITEDPALVPGDARVTWEGGRLDYSFSRICAAIRDTLRARARPHPEPEDRT